MASKQTGKYVLRNTNADADFEVLETAIDSDIDEELEEHFEDDINDILENLSDSEQDNNIDLDAIPVACLLYTSPSPRDS